MLCETNINFKTWFLSTMPTNRSHYISRTVTCVPASR